MTLEPTLSHTPVLLHETIAAFAPYGGHTYVDATLGGGGHSLELAKKLNPQQLLLGIDRDPVAINTAQKRFTDESPALQPQILLNNVPFAQISQVLLEEGLAGIDGGLMMDLGMSNLQLKDHERGFSFMNDGPLDMRMNPKSPLTVAEIVNSWEAEELTRILKDYADERIAKPLANAIVKTRPHKSTLQLAQLARELYQFFKCQTHGTHPATRLFQALRMAVNQETQQLETMLEALPGLLLPWAKVAIITFHSIEDRLVKQAFKRYSVDCICPPRLPVCECNHKASFKLLGKPIEASAEELKQNPQARSAKLRLAQRL